MYIPSGDEMLEHKEIAKQIGELVERKLSGLLK
jgi:hypothetical protein